MNIRDLCERTVSDIPEDLRADNLQPYRIDDQLLLVAVAKDGTILSGAMLTQNDFGKLLRNLKKLLADS
jgi:hypothetical protein